MNKRKQGGMSIIEILLAVGMGTLLGISLVSLFSNNKAHSRLQHGLVDLQNNARFAHYLLNRDVHMAGYLGCAHINGVTINTISLSPPEDVSVTADNIINGYESTGDATWSSALPTSIATQVTSGTDVLEIRKISASTLQPLAAMTDTSTPIQLSANSGLAAGDVVLIGDCSHADVFTVSSISGSNQALFATSHNSTDQLSKAYQQEATLSPYQVHRYYIADSGRTSSAGSAILSLYRSDLDGSSTELVPGVENLQITYGVDSDGDNNIDSYVNAQTVASNNDWANVISVDARLLMATQEEVLSQAKNYQFNGSNQTATDNRYRHELQSYIKLRNRGL